MPRKRKDPPERPDSVAAREPPVNPGVNPAVDHTTPDKSLPFPIAAVGASAGGMLGALPVDTGMAFVIVQHLSPAHGSMLAEIRARATRHDYPLGRRRRERKGLSQSRLTRAVALIDERLAEPLAVNEIASAVHLSPFHFARMFRRSTGCSPHEYLTRRRLERAKQLLAGSDLSMLQIAHTVGYRTQAHFTRVFHEGTGTTPRRYRLAHRVGAER